MSYIMLSNEKIKGNDYAPESLEGAVLSFIRESCEELRFDKNKATSMDAKACDSDGKSIKSNQIPFNMEKDIDRLCLENALDRFLKSGKKEDAFDVYFCYLEMFVGDYKKTRRMIELLSEYEANGSGLLMKHRDHYSHSVYVFALGLAIYQSNEKYRDAYKKHYGLSDDKEVAHHYLEYWGLSSLFHDIGYPFELPFEQVCSYFEVEGDKRSERPFVAYRGLESFIKLNEKVKKELLEIVPNKEFKSINEVFAYTLANKMGTEYNFTEEQMLQFLIDKPTKPNDFNHFMDHAYFSATVLFKKLFEEMGIKIQQAHLDALTAILMHNSLYKFCIAHYKSEENKPFKMELHPLAYMLMLCDELQCWDRTAYGRNSKKELHPMGCTFDFSNNNIRAFYLFDERELAKVNRFKDEYIEWLQNSKKGNKPKLKAYSGIFIREKGSSDFQEDIERIVDLSDIKLNVETGLAEHVHAGNRSYLSDSSYINLYNFAVILNGRWGSADWKRAKLAGQEEKFLQDDSIIKKYNDEFENLSLEYKLSNINQAKAFAKYMNEIGCFYTDKSVDFEFVEEFTNDELVKIGKLEHRRWLQEHYDMGWTYGEKGKDVNKGDRELKRMHWDMIPGFTGFYVSEEASEENYKRLDKAEQDKDIEPMECMLAMLKVFGGLRLYRL